MKTAGRENPNHGATLPHNRAHGAVGQNRSRSIRGAAKQEKFQPKGVCFFLTSPFIELLRMWHSRGWMTNSPFGCHLLGMKDFCGSHMIFDEGDVGVGKTQLHVRLNIILGDSEALFVENA